jgi:hypothetical protein
MEGINLVDNSKKALKLRVISITLGLVVILAILNFIGNDPGEKNLKRFITNHYTVTSDEIDSFKKYSNGDTEEYIAAFNKKIEEMSEFLTKKGIESYRNMRMPELCVFEAFSGNYTATVKDVKLKLKGIQDEGLLSYDTTFTIVKRNIKDGNETEETVEKTFYLSKENNQWKVNEFNKLYK